MTRFVSLNNTACKSLTAGILTSRWLLVVLLTLSFGMTAQEGSLHLDIYIEDANTNLSLALYPIGSSVALCHKEFVNEAEIRLDSLKPGKYKLNVFDHERADSLYFTKYVTVQAGMATYAQFNIESMQERYPEDTLNRSVHRQRDEAELDLTYMQNSWLNSSSAINHWGVIGFSGYSWLTFSRHLGFLYGGGLGIGQYVFSKDSSYIKTALSFKKINEHYNYMDVRLDAKFRLTSGNQKVERRVHPGLTVDMGASWHLPVFFRDAAIYEDDKKIINKHLHQFTDFRAFVHVGFSPVMFFFEYRLSDFVIGNYPELPRYNAGLRFLFHNVIID